MSFVARAGLYRVRIRERPERSRLHQRIGRQLEASSHVRWHQEREHPRRTGRPAGQADHRVRRPLHPDGDVRASLGRPRQAWQFISGQEPALPDGELGWKSLGVLELTALPSIDEERWIPLVQETDVLLVEGGDATYLCHWMRQCGLADLLPSLHEMVWVGVSAGSMVMTPRIGDDFVAGTARRQRPHARDRRLLDLPASRLR